MSFVEARTDSGLVYPAQGMDGAAVRAALKDHDRNLDLTQQIDPDWQRWVYKVTYAVSPGHEEVLFAWRDERTQEPLPLSSALVDKVKLLDRNTRIAAPNADRMNEQLRTEQQRRWEDTHEAMAGDFVPLEGRSPMLHRSQKLRQSRDRQRAKGKKV